MSSLRNIASSPKLTKFLADNKTFKDSPLMVIDAGVRGGFEEHWQVFKDQIRLIGFDPDSKECLRINKATNSEITCYPYALSDKNGRQKLNLFPLHPSSSSFYTPDINFINRFPDGKYFSKIKTIVVDTISLDSFIQKFGLEYIDFIKLDVEGSELEVLKGATKLLKGGVLGITLEVTFNRVHLKSPLFSDLDQFLRENGFKLYDLGLIRLARKSLSSRPEPSEFGQVIGGHALYFKDGFQELTENKKNWNYIKILKLASLMEIFGLADCALELLQIAYLKKYLKTNNINSLYRLLKHHAIMASYKNYLNRFKECLQF